jgi:hypothetical protein
LVVRIGLLISTELTFLSYSFKRKWLVNQFIHLDGLYQLISLFVLELCINIVS